MGIMILILEMRKLSLRWLCAQAGSGRAGFRHSSVQFLKLVSFCLYYAPPFFFFLLCLTLDHYGGKAWTLYSSTLLFYSKNSEMFAGYCLVLI